jgi:hypothetical protein
VASRFPRHIRDSDVVVEEAGQVRCAQHDEGEEGQEQREFDQ